MQRGVVWLVAAAAMLCVAAILCSFVSRAQEPVPVDLANDLCADFKNERLSVPEVRGQLHAGVATDNPDWAENEREFWLEMRQLISRHNSKHAMPQYRFAAAITFHMTLVPYRGMASSAVCDYYDVNNCRSRNFWFFKRLPPKQLAQIVFDNTVRKDTEIKRCPF
ncbi:MAG TPA: hypothetical protein VH765_05280 [Xanthobacteraceae bacterium]|jgi:hypothetical protein